MKTQTIRQYLFYGSMLAASLVLMSASAGKKYRDTSLSPAQRADLLMKEMTLEEKIGQMCQYVGPGHIKQNEQKDESVTVSFDVTNTGRMDGTEIVQLYIRDEYGSITRPVKELKGFQRVYLKAGET